MFIIPAASADVRSGHCELACNWYGKCTGYAARMKGNTVNQDILKGKWLQAKEDVCNWWGHLTDDDVDEIQGDIDRFVRKLQQRYGYGREQAERELNDFLRLPDNERRRIA
jgi:uncharacterized protein YjbJ (UPF0337 family)